MSQEPAPHAHLPKAVAGVLAMSFLLNAVIELALAPPWNQTVLTPVLSFVQGHMGSDSWGPMDVALWHIDSRDPRLLYDAVLFQQGVKFQYPPTALLVRDVLLHSLGASALPQALNVITWVAVAVTALVAGVLLAWGSAGRRRATLMLLGSAATLTFYPVVKAYELGQIQAWISALAAVILWAWIRGRRGLAGVLLGLICLIKPHFALVGLWALLRGERRFAGAAALTALTGLGLSTLRYGLDNHLNYLAALSFLGRHGESYYPNQSANGLLHRFFLNGDNLAWHSDSFPPFHPLVFVGTLCSSLVLAALALFWPGTTRTRGGPFDLSGVLLATVMASPITWESHYGLLPPLIAILAPWVLRVGATTHWPGFLLTAGYLLSANFFAVTRRLAETPWNPLQSYLYFGALLIFGLLLAARTREV